MCYMCYMCVVKKLEAINRTTLVLFTSCTCFKLSCVNCCLVVLCVLLSSNVYMCTCCATCVFAVFTLDAGLLARSRYSEGPATGHLDTGFSWFSCA